MKHKIFFVLFVGLLSFLSACTTAKTTVEPTLEPFVAATVPPTVTPEQLPEWQSFVSQKFDYAVSVPEGWFPKERYGEWADYDPLDAKVGSGIDSFAIYVEQRVLTIGIGARVLSEDTTLEDWMETAKTLIRVKAGQGVCYETPEDDPVSVESILLDGVQAVLMEYRCPLDYDSFGLVALAIHRGEGYWITWISPQGREAEDRENFVKILEAFSFTEK